MEGREILSAKELSNYLGLNEKLIYRLAREGRIPAARIGGKWLFPRRLIDKWVEKDALGRLKFRDSVESIVIIGSNDPIWDIVTKVLSDFPYGILLCFSSVGSTKGLIALSEGICDGTCSHLLDTGTGEYNIPFLSRYLEGEDLVVISLFKRVQGLMVRHGNPKGIKGVEDIARKDVVFINRQEGSGTRVLLDAELTRLGINPEVIRGYKENVAYTHLEVGLRVLKGEGDVGLGCLSVSSFLGLDFIPLREERYDLVVQKEVYRTRKVNILLDVLSSRKVRSAIEKFGGYNTESMGEVVWEGRA